MSNSQKESFVETDYRLTTFDNPFDPFTEFSSWYRFDTIEKGYNTCGYLDRVSDVSDDMSQKEVNEAIEKAIDNIIKIDPFNMYKKVKRQETITY